jgi:hypothetical protein
MLMIYLKNYCNILLIATIPFSFLGCLRTYYPLYYYSNPLPIVNETDNNLNEGTKFFSLDFTHSEGEYAGEFSNIIRGNYVFANTQNHSNFNFSLYGFGGSYKVSDLYDYSEQPLKKYDGNKTAFGAGAEMKFTLNFKFDNVKLGFGLGCALTTEFGQYTNFREEAQKHNAIDSKQGWIFVTGLGFPYLSFELADDINLTTQLNIGYPGVLSPIISLNKGNTICWINVLYNGHDKTAIRTALGIMVDMNQIFQSF